ncbi:transcriptional regulator [Neisseria chenwenguii]|uniref:Transcriptional regulator n=1 Tax=Neisseria chenwenguii TaxID=1853278 RepID=A0A220S275_9NEIS|nr:transcriptional regulator [Neisseria chenwenguii]ASK27513.1 transcriptional regulator [Neisseria chenwenguii]ROV55593.1 transcriptional regulator [Neisseria chenwenguii]
MYTIIETPIFTRLCDDILDEEERGELAVYLAEHPLSGDVVPKSGGCRKLRWQRRGLGKRGGARIIYFNRLENGEIHLLLIYAKAKNENIPAHILLKLREELL